MTVRPPIIAHSGIAASWEAVEATFGVNRYGLAPKRVPKGSWLALLRKQYPKPEALGIVQSWMVRLLWLRRLEIWLIETHNRDASFAFLDATHIQCFDDVSTLFQTLEIDPEERNESFLQTFPLLPKLPIPRWFSNLKGLDLPVGTALRALARLDVSDIEAYGRQAESPLPKAAPFSTQDDGPQQVCVHGGAEDGSLFVAHARNVLHGHLPEEHYRVDAGPGGYRRTMPMLQSQWESAALLLKKSANNWFAVCPSVAAADRCLFHMTLEAIRCLHFSQSDGANSLPAFHHCIRVGDAFSCKLDVNLPLKGLLPKQAARLGMWRTSLKRFHASLEESSKDEARSVLADLPRHFRIPLRPDGPIYRRLQRMLALRQQQQSNLFGSHTELATLDEAIEVTRKALQDRNREAFEWRYAFPELLEPDTGDFCGFGDMCMSPSEMNVDEDPLGLLRQFQVAYQVLRPGGRCVAWLPDDFMRHRRFQPVRSWLQQTGNIVETTYAAGDQFDAMITGKLVLAWKKG
ncbi:MAG: hypothetical protein AB8F95_02445 [Bacteroidia bacterium]